MTSVQLRVAYARSSMCQYTASTCQFDSTHSCSSAHLIAECTEPSGMKLGLCIIILQLATIHLALEIVPIQYLESFVL